MWQRDRSLLSRRGLGTSEELDPQLLPHPKNNRKHFCIQQPRETGISSRKSREKGKKAGFQIRDHANPRQTQPPTQQSMGTIGTTATAPINTRDWSEGAAVTSPGDEADPHWGCPASPAQAGETLGTYPSREEAGREDHCRTERRTTRDNREGKTQNKTRAGMPGKSRARRGARQPPLPLASPWPAAPGELKKKKKQQTCTLKEGLKKKSLKKKAQTKQRLGEPRGRRAGAAPHGGERDGAVGSRCARLLGCCLPSPPDTPPASSKNHTQEGKKYRRPFQ